MGRKKRSNFVRVYSVNRANQVTAFSIVGSNKATHLEKPIHLNEFRQKLDSTFERNPTSQSNQIDQQVVTNLQNNADQGSNQNISHKEFGLNNPEFEDRLEITLDDDDDENNFFIFDAESLMKDQLIFKGTIDTYDSTAFFTKYNK